MGKIKVHIDTSEYEGKMSKSVIVETDDPDMPEFQLTVKAEIISPIQIQPKRVYFIGRKKEILKAEVKIKANINKPLKIKPILSLLSPYFIYFFFCFFCKSRFLIIAYNHLIIFFSFIQLIFPFKCFS